MDRRVGVRTPSWFLWIVCERCGKQWMISETHMAHGEMLIRDIVERMRHDGCGGRPQFVKLRQPTSAPDCVDRTCRSPIRSRDSRVRSAKPAVAVRSPVSSPSAAGDRSAGVPPTNRADRFSA